MGKFFDKLRLYFGYIPGQSDFDTIQQNVENQLRRMQSKYIGVGATSPVEAAAQSPASLFVGIGPSEYIDPTGMSFGWDSTQLVNCGTATIGLGGGIGPTTPGGGGQKRYIVICARGFFIDSDARIDKAGNPVYYRSDAGYQIEVAQTVDVGVGDVKYTSTLLTTLFINLNAAGYVPIAVVERSFAQTTILPVNLWTCVNYVVPGKNLAQEAHIASTSLGWTGGPAIHTPNSTVNAEEAAVPGSPGRITLTGGETVTIGYLNPRTNKLESVQVVVPATIFNLPDNNTRYMIRMKLNPDRTVNVYSAFGTYQEDPYPGLLGSFDQDAEDAGSYATLIDLPLVFVKTGNNGTFPERSLIASAPQMRLALMEAEIKRVKYTAELGSSAWEDLRRVLSRGLSESAYPLSGCRISNLTESPSTATCRIGYGTVVWPIGFAQQPEVGAPITFNTDEKTLNFTADGSFLICTLPQVFGPYSVFPFSAIDDDITVNCPDIYIALAWVTVRTVSGNRKIVDYGTFSGRSSTTPGDWTAIGQQSLATDTSLLLIHQASYEYSYGLAIVPPQVLDLANPKCWMTGVIDYPLANTEINRATKMAYMYLTRLRSNNTSCRYGIYRVVLSNIAPTVDGLHPSNPEYIFYGSLKTISGVNSGDSIRVYRSYEANRTDGYVRLVSQTFNQGEGNSTPYGTDASLLSRNTAGTSSKVFTDQEIPVTAKSVTLSVVVTMPSNAAGDADGSVMAQVRINSYNFTTFGAVRYGELPNPYGFDAYTELNIPRKKSELSAAYAVTPISLTLIVDVVGTPVGTGNCATGLVGYTEDTRRPYAITKVGILSMALSDRFRGFNWYLGQVVEASEMRDFTTALDRQQSRTRLALGDRFLTKSPLVLFNSGSPPKVSINRIEGMIGGKEIYLSSNTIIDLSVSTHAIVGPTEVTTAGYERWLVLAVGYAQTTYEDRVDVDGQPIKNRTDDALEIRLYAGTEAPIGDNDIPSVDPDFIPIAYIYRQEGPLLKANIHTDYTYVKANGGVLDQVRCGNILASVQHQTASMWRASGYPEDVNQTKAAIFSYSPGVGSAGEVWIGEDLVFLLEGQIRSLSETYEGKYDIVIWKSSDTVLSPNTTYFLRAQLDEYQGLHLYLQGGSLPDSPGESYIYPDDSRGTPGASTGGEFPTTRMDLLIAKVTTGALGTEPTIVPYDTKGDWYYEATVNGDYSNSPAFAVDITFGSNPCNKDFDIEIRSSGESFSAAGPSANHSHGHSEYFKVLHYSYEKVTVEAKGKWFFVTGAAVTIPASFPFYRPGFTIKIRSRNKSV